MTPFSDRLRRAKNDKGWSNRQLARECGLAPSTVDQYMRDSHSVPDEPTIEAFHSALGIPLGELRQLANLPPGEQMPYQPPLEANRLSQRQRDAFDELIRSVAVPIDDLQELEAILRRLSGEDLDRAAHLAAELVDQREQAQVDEYLADQRQAQQSPSNVIDPRPKNWDQSPLPPGDEVTPAASEGLKGSDDEEDDDGRS